jgi:hypothetical protein
MPPRKATVQAQALKLLRRNMPPSWVAELLEIPPGEVAKISRSVGIVRAYPSAEDREIADAIRRLTMMCLDGAMDIVMFGNYRERGAMIRTVVARTMGVIGSESPLGLEEMRAEWAELIGSAPQPEIVEAGEEGEAEEPSAE